MKRVLVVLSGGAMKGLAHIGALRVIDRMGLPVVGYAGTSVGSLVAALASSGMSIDEMHDHGLKVSRKTILDFDWRSLLVRQFRTPGLNRGDALFKFITETIPIHKFEEMQKPLYVNAVDLVTGANVIFGLPGLMEIPVPEAVAASCAIPGIYAPRKIGNGYFADGSIVDNLQLRLAKLLDIDFIVAINLRGFNIRTNEQIDTQGFLEIINRGNDLTGQLVTEINLARQFSVPMIIVHPDVAKYDSFTFDDTEALIAEGERATEAAFERFYRSRNDDDSSRWRMRGNQSPFVGNPFVIDQSLCTRCALCVINNHDGLFETKAPGEIVTVNRLKPSTHELAPVKECPFGAVRVDADLLAQMYGDEPPELLARLARDGSAAILGHAPFAPLPVPPRPKPVEKPAEGDPTEKKLVEKKPTDRRLAGWSARRRAAVAETTRVRAAADALVLASNPISADAVTSEPPPLPPSSGNGNGSGNGSGNGNGREHNTAAETDPASPLPSFPVENVVDTPTDRPIEEDTAAESADGDRDGDADGDVAADATTGPNPGTEAADAAVQLSGEHAVPAPSDESPSDESPTISPSPESESQSNDGEHR